ncbi:hypothetical protein EZV62_015035 [Acer yangbiense]|uniref:Uncharacterized protein n=1 Tax=Acer yangbiense TaxID=1000413 RepID=A0A5C7HWE0_9ROSI|nr:hypothetical protein EZV62_015035 [Acer yangbiense]
MICWQGTSAVESISLDLSQISELYLSPDTFMRMPRLKLLKLYNWHKEMDFKVQLLCEGLPDELRYLSWHGYPLKSLPIKFNPNLLVELEMYESNIQHLWKDTKFLGNLRRIGLFKCKQLTEVPDLSQAPKLQILQLHRCCSLTKFPKISWNLNKLNLSYTAIEEVPTSAIESLNKLGTLNIRYNTSIKNLPTSMRHLTSLRSLSLDGCSNITKFPEISGEITYLSLSETAIEEVPNSAIESLSKIVTLDICHNRRLKNLPNMRRLTSLKTLILHGCSNLAKFPEISDGITDLSLSETAIENVPSFVECFTNLRRFSLNHCRRLKRVSSSIFQLKLVSSLDLTGCSQLEDLPEVLENKEKLFSLYLERSALKTLPSSIELLPQLSILVMRDCKNIESLPNSLCNLTNLSRLDLSGCSGVGKMLENVLLSSSSSCLRSLRDLILSDCNMLVLPTALSCLSSLDCLSLKGNKFESLSLKLFTSLRRLDISYCERLQYLQEFPLPSHLEYLDASHCTSLETLPDTDVVSTKICSSDQCFKYYNCWKLDEKACINIQTDAQTRIQLMANNAQNGRVGVKFYFPGSEIPGWISYHSEGSSLTIDLPQHWYSNKLFGFVLCIVASNESSTNQGSSIVDCKCSFIDSDNCEWQENTYLLISNSEHPKWYQKSTYMLKSNGQYPKLDRESTYLFLQSYSTLSKYSFCKKARFHFSPSKDGCKVKRCGVHLVYSELEDELCKKARFYFSPSKDGCKVKKCGVYSELEDESTESTRGDIAKEDREEEYFDSESEVINTLCRSAEGRTKVIAKQIFLVGLSFSFFYVFALFMFPSINFFYISSQIFSLSSSTHCTPPLNHPLPPRLPLPFFNRNSYRPVFSNEAPNPRLLSVRAQIPGSDGFGSNKSVNLTDKESPIESSSSSTFSAIDFLTLCHSLKGPESIADHMYRMALMALIVDEVPGLNRERELGIVIVAHGPLGHGFFGGKAVAESLLIASEMATASTTKSSGFDEQGQQQRPTIAEDSVDDLERRIR